MSRNQGNNFINIHAHRHLNQDEYVILNRPPADFHHSVHNKVPYSSGIHPWRTGEEIDHEEEISVLKSLTADRLLMAIGESGLDRGRGAPMRTQQSLFELQADLAATSSKPMIIHCVRSFPELISIRKNFESSPPWIIHGFSGNVQIMKQLISHGFFISFGPSIIDATAKLAEVMLNIPLQRIFFETDDSYGRVEEIYYTFARLRGIEMTELAEKIRANFSVIWPENNL